MAGCCQNNTESAVSTCDTAAPARQESRAYRPTVDVIETPESIRLIADVPGAQADSIDIRFENGVLSLRAEVPHRQAADAHWRLREYGVGAWERSFRIGDDVDTSAIDAAFKDGVLTLTLPKAAHARPRKIEVRMN